MLIIKSINYLATTVTRRRRRRRRRRRDDSVRDQKSRNEIKAKDNDRIKQDKLNNEISNKFDKAADIIKEIKKALGEKEETAELQEDDWEDKFDEEDEIEF